MHPLVELLLILAGVPAVMAAASWLAVTLSRPVPGRQAIGLLAPGPADDGWSEEIARDGGVTLARASSFDAVLLEQDRRGAAGEFAQTY